MTHHDYLMRERAFAHTEATRLGAGPVEIGNYFITCAALYRAQNQLEHAQTLLVAAADAYACYVSLPFRDNSI